MPDDKQAIQAAEDALRAAKAAFDALPDDYEQPRCAADRKWAALERRFNAAKIAFNRDIDPGANTPNGDQERFIFPKKDENEERSFIANFTKGMSHDDLGEVQPRTDYLALLHAIETCDPADYEAIPRGPVELRPQVGPADQIPGPEQRQPKLRRYVNPQAAIAFSLMAPDPPQAGVLVQGSSTKVEPFPEAPQFSSAEAAAEMGELYWMSLLRDVPFNEFQDGTSNATVLAAVESLNRFSDFRGPKKGGKVTPGTLFRGGNYFRNQDVNQQISGGELVGPFLSQFLLIGTEILDGRGPVDQFSAGQPFGETEDGEKVIPPGSSTGISVKREDGMVQYGALTIDQRQREITPGLDFVTDYKTWLRIQEGFVPNDKNVFTGARKFMFNGRAAANWVHFDQSYEADYIALLLLLGMQGRADALGVPLFSEGNPYNPPRLSSGADLNTPFSLNQTGFGTFGNAHFLALIAEADRRAIEAVWHQKWNVHRRLRPEMFSGRIHNVQLTPALNDRYDISEEILREEDLLKRIFVRNEELNRKYGRGKTLEGTYLLSQVFPEGSPMHPSYGAGHATEAGARLTIMKAQFNEDLIITDGFQRTPDPSKPYNPALIASPDGTNLIVYRGQDDTTPLPVWQELNKLAANIATSRNIAGVHYRTDYSASLRMGEQVALGLLEEQAANFNEDQFFQLTLLSKVIVRVTRSGIIEVGRRP